MSTEAKEARKLIRTVVRETERLLDSTVGSGHVLSPMTLVSQVALNISRPLGEVESMVMTYLLARSDLTINRFGIRIKESS